MGQTPTPPDTSVPVPASATAAQTNPSESVSGNRAPPAWQKDVILRNGASLRLRPITGDDGERLQRLHTSLSTRSIYTRFMMLLPKLSPAQVKRFTQIDYDNEMAIVGIVADENEPGGERLICVGRYVRLHVPTRAEVAFTVADAYQGLGIATHLLQELLPFARAADIEVLEAEVLAENHAMLGVFRNMGFHVTASLAEGVVHIEFPVAETELSQEQRWAREQKANRAAMERLLRPRSVAVVGASDQRGHIGNTLVRNLLTQEFAGPVYPVNPKHRVVCSVPCYPSLQDIPDPVDLVIAAVPAADTLAVVHECAKKQVYGIIVITAGFGETGPQGRALEAELLDVVRRQGIRMVGPNCLGLLNADPAVRLNGTFAPVYPPSGRVALSSQSGALAIAILNLARELRLGISQFVSVGNKADVSGNDLMQYWGDDPGTDVILLYMESFGNPKKFSRIARAVSRKKPVIVLKSGNSAAGARAASSHTGALSSNAVVAKTLMDQAGIVQTDSMERFFHAAKVLGTQPLPDGHRLAILTNAGGPAILSADRAEAEGLAVPQLSDKLQAKLRKVVLPTASVHNPVDLVAQASVAQYEASLKLLLESDEIDQVAVLFIPPVVTRGEEVARAILRARDAVVGGKPGARLGKPLVACMMGEVGGGEAFDLLEAQGVPTFRFPEDAVTALAQLTRYRDWRMAPRGARVRFADTRKEEAQAILRRATAGLPLPSHSAPVQGSGPPAGAPAGSSALEEPGTWLAPIDAYAVLNAYGISTAPTRLARSAEEAAAHAAALGFPTVIKLSSLTITHKTDVQGVQLNLRTAAEVAEAYTRIERGLTALGRRAEMDGVLVQPMAHGGLEMVLGMSHDPSFGPVLMAGLGGIYLELFKDVQFALHPVTDREIAQMVDRLRSRPILDGYRGEPARDVDALQQILARLSQMIEENPQIRELDFNPVMVFPKGQGAQVVDVRLRAAPSDPYQEYVIAGLED
jgi:acetate---CoA ligase (ADP-forming)